MKTYITLTICLLAACLLGGCELDRFPYDKTINTGVVDVAKADAITLGIYAKLKEEYYYKTLHQVGEYGGDNISLSGVTSDALFNLYRYERLLNNYYPSRVWLFTYQMIGQINSLLPALEAYEPSPDEQESINHMIGENLLLRAFLYFNCCNVFGRPYMDANGPENNLGLPIKTVPDIDYFPPRSSVKEVYTQILADAKRGAALMKRSAATTPKSNIFVSREVAWAFLSRVHLYMGEYEQAGRYADSVITSNRYTLLAGEAYQKYPQHVPEENTETIWCIRMVKDADYATYHMDWYSVGSLYTTINNEGWGEMYPSESYLTLLRRHPEDLRFGFIDNQYAAGDALWMVYVNDANSTYAYATRTVERVGSGYVITQNPGDFSSPNVLEETATDGSTRYYVIRSSVRYNVWIERALQLREGFPKRFINKCSYQEQQAQLYSPVLYRLAEMYLTRAECRYHANDITGAIDDINVIRDRARIPLRQRADAGSDATVLDWVLEERRLELAWEAQRRYDIFRNGQTLDRRYPGSHLMGSQATVITLLPPNDPRIVEYIPQSEMDAYPGELVQNP